MTSVMEGEADGRRQTSRSASLQGAGEGNPSSEMYAHDVEEIWSKITGFML